MPAMIDVSCPKCGKRYGFTGRMTDCPACPKCGAEPDRAALEHDEKQMEEFKTLLHSRPKQSNCSRQRVAAGLSLGQAAKLLGIEPKALADVENGRADLSADLAGKMAEVYDVGITGKDG
jgi:DNA-binding XRE family transcriptional regulator